MLIPRIPQANSNQYKVLIQLLNEWPGVWVVSTPNISHKAIVLCVSKLREKGWPIEDIASDGYHSKHGYRIDKERWRSLRGKFKDEFWRF